MAIPNSLTLDTKSYERLVPSLSQWLDTSTNNDQPKYIELKSTITPDKECSFTVKSLERRNNPTVGKPDLKLQVYIVAIWDNGFTQADILAHEAKVHAFMTTGDLLSRAMRGDK